MADVIKGCADFATSASIGVVGVGDSVGDLIKAHRSIERSCVQIYVPRMSRREMAEIIGRAQGRTMITFTQDSIALITQLAQGFPHYVHLLGLCSALDAKSLALEVVDVKNVAAGIKAALRRTQKSLLDGYTVATESPRKDALLKHVLAACALAPVDLQGFFRPSDVQKPLSEILEKDVEVSNFISHLSQFISAQRGPILQRTGRERQYKFRFIDPMMQPMVIMQAINNNLISRLEDFVRVARDQLELDLGS